MKVDFDQQFRTLHGGRITMTEEDETPITLALVAVEALLQPQAEDAHTAGLAYRLYTLAHRIKDGGVVDLDANDVELIKQRVEKGRPPLIVGQAWDMLEGRDA